MKADLIATLFLALLGSVLGLLTNPSALRPRQLVVSDESRLSKAVNHAEWLRPIAPEDLLAALKKGGIQVVDARPATAYVAAHLPGSMPLWDSQPEFLFPQLLSLLDPESAVAVTDDQGNGYAAMKLAFLFRQRGFQTIYCLNGGLKSWLDLKLPTARGWDFPVSTTEKMGK